MALTLTMPDSIDTSPPFIPDDPSTSPTTATAQQAADLLERGEAEGEIVNGEIDTPPVEIQGDTQSEPKTVNNEIDATANGKPKRKRKPKNDSDKGINLSADPAPAGDQLKSPSPELSARMGDIKTSPATRSFQIGKVTAEYVEITLAINQHEETIELAKAEVKRLSEKQRALALELRHLRNDEEWQPELFSDTPQLSPAAADAARAEVSSSYKVSATAEGSTGQATTHAGEPVPTPAVAAPVDPPSNPDAWRTVSIDDLGLPPSITAKLIEDSISTLGQLEDLRGEISQRRAKWPKGIGLAKITLIEDAVVKWLTKNRDREAFAGVSQPAVTQDAANAEVTVKHPAQSHDAPPAAVFEGAWEDLTAEQQADFIGSRISAINTGQDSCLDRKHADSDKFWQSGYEQYGRVVDSVECTVLDCPYIPGIEMDDWIRGFLAAKAVQDYPTAKGKADPPEDRSEPIPDLKAALGDDIDDI